jgi:hypothetical protein
MKITTREQNVTEIARGGRARATDTQIRRLKFYGMETPPGLPAEDAQVAIDQFREADPDAEARYQAWRPCLIASLGSPSSSVKTEFDGTIRVQRVVEPRRRWKAVGLQVCLFGAAVLLFGWWVRGEGFSNLAICLGLAIAGIGMAVFIAGVRRS